MNRPRNPDRPRIKIPSLESLIEMQRDMISRANQYEADHPNTQN